MKSINKIFLITVFFLAGCSDDFLDRKSLTDLADDNFWTSEDDAYLGLMGCYDALQSSYLFNSDPWSGGVMRLECLSDNGYAAWSWMPLAGMATGQWSPTSWGESEFYGALYRAIARCNRVINFIPQIQGIDPAKAKRMVAEAKVIRATVYNILTMTYEAAPLVTTVLNVDNAQVPKSTKDEIVDFITEDLEGCYMDLEPKVTGAEWGRLSRAGALATLSRIYLYHGRFDKAAAKAKEVIDMGIYSLYPDYTTLFTAANEVNNEVLFTVTFERGLSGEGSDVAGHWDDFITYELPLPSLAKEFYCTDGLPSDQSPLFNPAHESQNRDPRFKTTLVANGDSWQGRPVTGQPTYYWRKWTEESTGVDHFDSPQDFYVIRYAHVLLMRAEALLQGSGAYDANEVIGLINKIRDRVGMPHVEDVEGKNKTLSRQELLNITKHEIRVETAYEGLRYFDQKRWGELQAGYQYFNENEMEYVPGMLKRTLDAKFLIWPLPQGEIDVNKALKQHEVWGG